MRRKLFTTLLLAGFASATGFGTALAVDYGPENFSALGRLYQPTPVGHTPGKDNGPGQGLHNAGEDCGICHRPEGKAQNYLFTVAGTLYSDRGAQNTVEGGEIILQDRGGNTLSMTSNKVGNFWTYTPLASNPEAVASHGGTTETLYTDTEPANPADSRTWQYKAWAKVGEQATPMITIAPVGSATSATSRMSCNMHHSAMGSRGGLWGSRNPTLGNYPEQGVGFQKHILPIMIAKCVPCHIPGVTETRLATRTDIETPATTVDYSNGQDFTSYGGSSVSGKSKKGIAYFALDYTGAPDESPLLKKTLAKPQGQRNHGGGEFWSAADPDYKAIRRWIAEGARNN